MKDLIKDYLENNIYYKYKNVELIWILNENVIFECGFKCDDDFGNRKIVDDFKVNIWEVLVFINNKLDK